MRIMGKFSVPLTRIYDPEMYRLQTPLLGLDASNGQEGTSVWPPGVEFLYPPLPF